MILPCLSQASSLMSLNSNTSTKTSQTKQSPVFHHTPTEKVIVPGIGIASQLPGGVVEVIYQDGSRLSVREPEHGGNTITFTHMNGNTYHYTKNDEVPEVVRMKLQHMPIVIKHLMAQNNPTMPLCTPVSNKCLQPPMKFFR